ncbi:hypothetical protein [Aquimarina sp. I32.4]|uniref:DUF7832 domain-containing protein n=1 Tax=Aquimarina sp. I32.4 TaxID=2053903 RepID=UPI000CDE6155|nr:hypothetical protein [Aquimarina sp. I32.4]
MKYDDYKWHFNDDFPKDLPKEATLIHIGMFMAWAIDNNLESDLLKENFSNELDKFRNRKITGKRFVELCCDYKLTSDDLNDKGNKFAEHYYDSDEYFEDYVDASNENNETIFHEEDTWDKYYEIKKVIDKKFEKWQIKK